MNTLAQVVAWLMGALYTWAPNAQDDTRARAAEEIVDVAYDESEPPLFDGDYARARTALLIGITASQESGLRDDVQAGHCRPRECDHGNSFCWMQVRARPAILLDGIYWRYVSTRFDGAILPSDLTDESTCLRVGLHMMRYSLHVVHSLKGYTGERGTAPRAKYRIQAVEQYTKRFPPPLEDLAVTGL